MYPAKRPLIATVLICAALVTAPAIASTAGENEKRLEEAVASCRGDPQCEAAVRKREIQAAEKRQKRATEDKALKERDPFAYYLTLAGRLLLFALFVCAAAGAYVLAMRVLFRKK